jgi:acylphosphatase
MVRVHVFISGRVQGVCFRACARRWAAESGLKGWVRNLYDGRVELAAEGDRTAVEALIERLKVGPPRAHVDGVEILFENPREEDDDFRVRPTDY